MRQTFFTLHISIIIATTLVFCGNSDQNKAIEQAKEVQSAIQQNPGAIPTTTSGYTMKAKLNGKDWTASSMMPPEASGRIIGYKNKEYIGLPYDRASLVAGNKTVFGEDNAVDLSTNDETGMWGGRKGEMEITMVSGNWVEGKFFVTAINSRSRKKLEVTDGFFRILIPKK